MQAADFQSLPVPFGTATGEVLAAILDQSADCIKVIGLNGTVDYMNRNGQCAMEIDDFCMVAGQQWHELWPEETRSAIVDALARARDGQTSRLEGFCPTAKGAPRWWDVSVTPLRGTGGAVEGFIATSRDITDRVNQHMLRDAVADEMRHRLRNNYVVVGSLLSAFSRGNADQERFAREMVERLTALGAAQTMKTSHTEICRLSELVPALIGPFATPDCPIRISRLPPVELTQAEIDALALVLGELAVNSTKHGALGASGEVTVVGHVAADGIDLIWTERSDRPVAAHARDGGQGFRLMDRVLASRRGGIKISWAEAGLCAAIRLGRINLPLGS